MKKLLIASTALVATAGMAAADITIYWPRSCWYFIQTLDNKAPAAAVVVTAATATKSV